MEDLLESKVAGLFTCVIVYDANHLVHLASEDQQALYSLALMWRTPSCKMLTFRLRVKLLNAKSKFLHCEINQVQFYFIIFFLNLSVHMSEYKLHQSLLKILVPLLVYLLVFTMGFVSMDPKQVLAPFTFQPEKPSINI